MGYRALYAWRRKSGALRRATPMIRWNAVPLAPLALHFRKPPRIVNERGASAAIEEADKILTGEFQLFSFHRVQAGFPPDWQADQLAAKREERRAKGCELGAEKLPHWTSISDAGVQDIKGVWELSRFPWAFALARAYATTQDPRYQDAFWKLFADWCARNPPNAGANWMCGQESTFRLMAVLFAVEAMGLPKEETERLTRFVVATGQRVAANLDYALSQKNNHGISECVGLITAAIVLRDQPQADRWLRLGLSKLQAQFSELIYPDGSFSQHSLIYHRVLLHDLVWVASRLRHAQQEVPEWLQGAARRALDFLIAITDSETGEAPLFGSNDGANILPLAEAEYLDMRPTIQMAAALFGEALPLPIGPWDEAAEWMAGSLTEMKRVNWPVKPPLWQAEVGGYAQLTAKRDRLFLRCPQRFRHRPAQADMMHVDIWLDGQAIAEDGGSFSYNSTERFKDLSQARYHNGLTIDGLEPMQKLSRFLYLPWPRGTVEVIEPVAKSQELGAGSDEQRATELRVAHDGYAALGVTWRRSVSQRPDGGFVVRDSVTGARGRRLTWHWRLSGLSWKMPQSEVQSVTSDKAKIHWHGFEDVSARLVTADEKTAWGWRSTHYAAVTPVTALLIEIVAQDRVELITEFVPIG